MIIACPECTSPFEIADGNIAPLVQVECPTCSFRMILDFAAANDAALREDGMAMAQGFRDELSYRQAVGAGHVSYAPTGAPEPQLQAPAPVPAPVADERPPVRQPPSEPASQPVTQRPPIRQPEPLPQTQPDLDRPPVRHPPEEPVVAQTERPRSRPTLIAHTPPAPRPPAAQPERPTPPVQEVRPAAAEAELETHVGPAPTDDGSRTHSVPKVPEQAPAPVEEEIELDDFDEPEPRAEPQAELRTPPHTPVREPAPELALEPASPGKDLELDTESGKPAAKPGSEAEPSEGKRSPAVNALMFLLLLILLVAGGLMVWSLVTTGDPFQKVLELTGQAQPALAPPAAPAQPVGEPAK